MTTIKSSKQYSMFDVTEINRDVKRMGNNTVPQCGELSKNVGHDCPFASPG